MAHFAVTENRVPTRRRLRLALAGLSPDAPVVIMLHGLKYDPDRPLADPHRQLFSLHPDPRCKRAVSWPRRLGLRGPNALAIGYGWRARGSLWQAHRRAGQTAIPLARMIRLIRELDPHRPVHIVAHSLGGRVALHCLAHLPAGSISRIILIAAAVFEKELADALDSPAGKSSEVINIRSRANTLFDILLRLALPHWGRTVGRGQVSRINLLDLAIDDKRTGQILATAGYAMPETTARICHWSGYIRSDACALYRALLHRPAATPLPYLQNLLQRGAVSGTNTGQIRALFFRPRLPF